MRGKRAVLSAMLGMPFWRRVAEECRGAPFGTGHIHHDGDRPFNSLKAMVPALQREQQAIRGRARARELPARAQCGRHSNVAYFRCGGGLVTDYIRTRASSEAGWLAGWLTPALCVVDLFYQRGGWFAPLNMRVSRVGPPCTRGVKKTNNNIK